MSVLVGLHIKRALAKVEAVTSLVGNRIYPLVIPQGVDEYPFICYDMNGETGDVTKDGVVNDIASVNVSIIAKTYEEVIIIGNAVRYTFDGGKAQYEEFIVEQVGKIQYNDEYIQELDAYAVNIGLEFKTIDY